MQKTVNTYDKELVYNYYIVLVDKPKSYSNITRFKMLQEIQSTFKNDPEEAIDFMLLNNFKKFLKVAKEDETFVEDYEADIFSQSFLEDMFYLEDIKTEGHNVSVKLLPEIKSAFNTLEDIEQIIETKEIESAILGSMDVYGYLDLNQVEEFVYDVFEVEDFIVHYHNAVINRLFINEYSYEEYGRYYFNDMFIFDSIENLPSPRVIYDKELYIEFANYGAPLQAAELYESLHPYISTLKHYPFITTRLNASVQYLEDPFAYFENLIREGRDPKEIAMHFNWPIWMWGGMTFLSYYDAIMNESIRVSNEFIENTTSLVHKALMTLQSQNYDSVRKEDIVKIIKSFYAGAKSKQETIRDLPNQNSEDIKPFEHAIIIDKGVVLEVADGIAEIYHENTIYFVKSYTLLLEDFIDYGKVPCHIDAVLLPLDNGVTFVGDIIISDITDDETLENIQPDQFVSSIDDLFNELLN